MTLSNVAIYFYLFFMFTAPIAGFFKILEFGLKLSVLLYIIQLALYAYGGGYHTFLRFKVWKTAKDRADRIKKGEVFDAKSQLKRIYNEGSYNE